MVNRRTVAAAVVLAAVLFSVWYFFPTRKRQVIRQLKSLAGWASKGGVEGALTAADRASKADEYFAPKCDFSSDTYDLSGTFTPRDIMRYVLAARTRVKTIELRFYDIAVTFTRDGAAHVTATARVTGISRDGDAINETHEVKLTLVKMARRWLITKASVVQVLQK